MKKMHRFTFALLIAAFITSIISAQDNGTFSKKDFYKAMASKDVTLVDKQLSLLEKSDFSEKPAFQGALVMKKAGLVKGAGKKLKTFKEGHKKLEAAISKDNENGEYRFLRLMIQENAPGILGYKDDLDKDSAYIRQSFKKLPADVQQAIASYSKTSKVLRSEDF